MDNTINKAKEHQYMRAKQAAKHFAIGAATLWIWAKKPGFPKPHKVGTRITLFDVAAIQNWIDEQQ